MSGDKPLATGEGTQMGVEDAARGLQPPADAWVRDIKTTDPSLCIQMPR